MARNEQAHLQRTLNKGAGGASLTIFVAGCRLFTTKNSKKTRKVGKGIFWLQFSLKKMKKCYSNQQNLPVMFKTL